MQIVKTLEEARQVTIGLQTVHFILQKKDSASKLHDGYIHLLDTGRQYGKKIMVSFMYSHVINDFATELENLTLTPIYNNEGVFNSHLFEWDKDGCIAWAGNKNIDVLWIPEYQDEIDIIQVPKLKYYRTVLATAWEEEGYLDLISHPIINDRAKTHCLGRLTADADWKYVGSWKDGIFMLVLAHFTNKYTKARYIMPDPIKAPEGIYYSSSYFNYTDKEKEYLAKIEPTVMSFDFNKDLGILKDNLNVFGKEINLKIIYLKSYVHPEIIGPNRRIVYVNFIVGNNKQDDIYSFMLR